jgi:hypothetical protein
MRSSLLLVLQHQWVVVVIVMLMMMSMVASTEPNGIQNPIVRGQTHQGKDQCRAPENEIFAVITHATKNTTTLFDGCHVEFDQSMFATDFCFGCGCG